MPLDYKTPRLTAFTQLPKFHPITYMVDCEHGKFKFKTFTPISGTIQGVIDYFIHRKWKFDSLEVYILVKDGFKKVF